MMQQPVFQQEQASNQGQQQQQMLLCPVRLVYETQILVQPGDQIRPNQTILINPQNQPPWAQNRLQNQVIYLQNVPNNYMPPVQQSLEQNQMFLQQNYGFPQVIQHPMLTQNQDQIRTLQVSNVPASMQSQLPTNLPQLMPSESMLTHNYGHLQVNSGINLQSGAQNQIANVPISGNNRQVQNVPKTVTEMPNNTQKSQEVSAQSYRQIVNQSLAQQINLARGPIQQTIAMINMPNMLHKPATMEHNANQQQINTMQQQVIVPSNAVQQTFASTSTNVQMEPRKTVPMIQRAPTHSVQGTMTHPPKNQTYSYRPIQPRPQQVRPNVSTPAMTVQPNMNIQMQQSPNVIDINRPQAPNVANASTSTNFPKVDNSNTQFNRKRKSESPDELRRKLTIVPSSQTISTTSSMTVKRIDSPAVAHSISVTKVHTNEIGVNTTPMMKVNTKQSNTRNMIQISPIIDQNVKIKEELAKPVQPTPPQNIIQTSQQNQIQPSQQNMMQAPQQSQISIQPQQHLMQIQQNLIQPQQNVMHSQQNMVHPQQQAIQTSQQSIVQPQQHLMQTQQNIIQPQQVMQTSQQNLMPPQQQIIQTSQHNLIQPQQHLMLPSQQNLIQPQQLIQTSQQNLVQPQQQVMQQQQQNVMPPQVMQATQQTLMPPQQVIQTSQQNQVQTSQQNVIQPQQNVMHSSQQRLQQPMLSPQNLMPPPPPPTAKTPTTTKNSSSQVEKEKLVRNTVFTQARFGRLLTDKDDIPVNINAIAPKEPTTPEQDKNIKSEVKKDVVSPKTEVKREEARSSVKQIKTEEPRSTPEVKEEKPVVPERNAEEKMLSDSMNRLKGTEANEIKLKNDRDYILTHVLDGFVIQESNVAFPIRLPLKEKTLAINAEAKKNIKEEADREVKSDRVPDLSHLNLRESEGQSEEQENKMEVDLPVNPFTDLKHCAVKSWTVEELAEHLSKFDWTDTITVLQEHEIDGESLFLVSKSQLVTIGVKEEHADVICEFVKG